jgi:basic amino acid/polyamine antiporter, APA family
MRRITVRKTLESVRADAEGRGLKRSLGPVQLTLIGIGCIIGAGVYVMTGTAAANYAGPAVVISFFIAGIACGLTALCYAELSSALPVSGASYTYAYTALGEVFAWALGWMLMLEFSLAGALLAAGFAGYLVSLLADLGIIVPHMIDTPLIQGLPVAHGIHFAIGGGINLVALASLGAVALVLVRGISQSAVVNATLVVIKVAVLVTFVSFGWSHVHPANWTPFVPPSEGGFRFGTPGIFRAASILFFAYLGFEVVANASSEARRPQRDVPIAIIAALGISTLLYALVALVLTGLVPFRTLGVPDPIAIAVAAIGMPALTILIKLGALTGLASVLLVNTFGHSRVCFAMACDGLLPDAFARVHPLFRTPARGTLLVAAVAGIAAAVLPISVLADLTSIGTAFVFLTVAVSVMWLRSEQPDLPRPFRLPLGGIRIGRAWIGVIPVLSLLSSLLMMAPVLIDIGAKAVGGEWVPAVILGLWIVAGALLYAFYGSPRSKAALALEVSA